MVWTLKYTPLPYNAEPLTSRTKVKLEIKDCAVPEHAPVWGIGAKFANLAAGCGFEGEGRGGACALCAQDRWGIGGRGKGGADRPGVDLDLHGSLGAPCPVESSPAKTSGAEPVQLRRSQ